MVISETRLDESFPNHQFKIPGYALPCRLDRKKKWLLCCTYNPNRYNTSSHLDLLRTSLDLYSAEYEHFIIVGDFNTKVTQTSMKVFCDSYEFKNLIKDVTCYKNPENPSSIDLILTNNPNSFQN